VGEVVRVLGIDASTVSCGFAIVDGKQLLQWRHLPLKGSQTHKERRRLVALRCMKLEAKYKPDLIAIERLRLFHRGMIKFETIVALASLWAIISDAVSVPTFTVPTQTWKRVVLGRGNATKDDSVAWVKREYGIDVNHDVADAICIARFGLLAASPSFKSYFRKLD